jgi:hypothetical protein
MRVMMTKLKLTVNETKTRVSKLPEEKFDFSGVYVWPLLLDEDGTRLSGHGSGQEASDPHLSGDQQRDWTQ